MEELIELQCTMFTLIFIGFLLKRIGMIGDEGKKNLTDLVINLVLPCNIIRSFMIELDYNVLITFAGVFIISVIIQCLCSLAGHILYRNSSISHKKCLQYATICSNAGFLGNPVAEGVFGSMGLTLASIYLIPQRIVMWSAGISIFTEAPSKKALFRKVITHPCIVACIVGLILMITQVSVPGFVQAPITSLSNCNTALSMMVIGTILAEVDLRTILDREVIYYTIMRLVLIPLAVWPVCILLHLNQLATGVCVLLAAMPAGATTSILAAKYDGDAKFATKVVIFSTLMSLVTTPVWNLLLT